MKSLPRTVFMLCLLSTEELWGGSSKQKLFQGALPSQREMNSFPIQEILYSELGQLLLSSCTAGQIIILNTFKI